MLDEELQINQISEAEFYHCKKFLIRVYIVVQFLCKY